MAEPTERDRERAAELVKRLFPKAAKPYPQGMSIPERMSYVSACAQALADERARNAARLREWADHARGFKPQTVVVALERAADALEADHE